MEKLNKLVLIVILSISLTIFALSALIYACRRKRERKDESFDKESSLEMTRKRVQQIKINGELIRFKGGENLTSAEILDAPGEVIGKSSYGTLYRANLAMNGSVVCLRFLRPSCAKMVQDLMDVVRVFGSIRHPNLVPLYGFYFGTRGEKLLVHPFCGKRNLAQFIKDKKDGECHKKTVVSSISIGIARGLDYLHTGLENPIIHGNLKLKNIFLDQNQQPLVSDFGLHAFLNPNAAQEMLETAGSEGYKAPELTKTEDMNEATDVYNFGLILLELITGNEQVNGQVNEPVNEAVNDISQYDEDLNSKSVVFNEFFSLAMDCCSPSPSLRPNIKQICRKLEEI